MADRYPDRPRLGGVCGGVFRHGGKTQDVPHLRPTGFRRFHLTVAILHIVNSAEMPVSGC